MGCMHNMMKTQGLRPHTFLEYQTALDFCIRDLTSKSVPPNCFMKLLRQVNLDLCWYCYPVVSLVRVQ
uniref:Uncharacterized protein n=2 Tax=Anguilla anguilla TaxID=7936 RepID=A0A0E9RT79_ANGAN